MSSGAIDPLTERWIELGRQLDKDMALGAMQRCNCMVRYKDGGQMPAIHHGKQFLDPQYTPITKPDSFEDMPWQRIVELMRERNEVYIGHMFGPYGEKVE